MLLAYYANDSDKRACANGPRQVATSTQAVSANGAQSYPWLRDGSSDEPAALAAGPTGQCDNGGIGDLLLERHSTYAPLREISDTIPKAAARTGTGAAPGVGTEPDSVARQRVDARDRQRCS